jgi:hypothetical protein
MSTPSVEIKSAGYAGATGVGSQSAAPATRVLVLRQPAPLSQSVKLRLAPFMQEDYIDSLAARHALSDPENTERVPWQQLKDQLGL